METSMKSRNDITALLASIRAGLYAQKQQQQQQTTQGVNVTLAEAPRFVTVSRQAGAGGRTFAARLVDRLNEGCPGSRPWAAWDRELVEKVAAENHIPASVVEQLDRRPRSPLED